MKWISSTIIILVSGQSFANDLISKSNAEVLNKKSYQIELEAGSWASSSTVDVDGNAVEFSDNEGFSKLEGDLNFRYGYSKKLELNLGALFRQVKSTSLEASKSGGESFRLGAKYQFDSRTRWKYSVDVGYKSTLYTNTDYTTTSEIPDGEMVLGDSGSGYHARGTLSYKSLSGNHINGSLAYVGMPNNLSSELVYDINGHLVWESFALYAGVEGVNSMGTDPYTSEPTTKPPQGRGETALYNSINRSYMKPYIGLYKTFGKTRWGLKYAQVMSGVSTDLGSEILVNLAWNSRGETVVDRKLSKFKEYDIEASVIKVSPRGKFLKIDKGLSQDVEKGQRFDIYQTDYFGGNTLVAQGFVQELAADWAIVKLSKKFKKIAIKSGFTARGLEK
ncbi:hypothetical protein [Halobacteriovorax sp. HLS]|uniref:hypothetical protein n=1 Tax=Halobacteriovorax sp. HLS TaxID=2234000 RepID=UPI000FDA6349|nr:hypothetical protein [Halobacteriovorax sp. HLS]